MGMGTREKLTGLEREGAGSRGIEPEKVNEEGGGGTKRPRREEVCLELEMGEVESSARKLLSSLISHSWGSRVICLDMVIYSSTIPPS